MFIIVTFKMMSKWCAWLFLFLCVLLSFSVSYAEDAYVKKVIDGDTIVLSNGEKVRYIGMDAPELHHKNKDVVAMGEKAKEFNASLVGGKKVRLEYDVEQYDKYGRVLAYVYVGGTFVNAEMVKEGYAMAFTYPPNVKYQELFLKLQKEARDAGKGLWADIDNQATSNGEQGTVNNQNTEYQFVARKDAEPFHFLWCKWAKKIPESKRVYYKTREEALKALHRPCHVCKP